MRRLVLPISVVGLLAGLLLFPGVAGAVGTGGAFPFALAPVAKKGLPLSSYFQLNLAAGATAHESVEVSDTGRNAETILVSSSHGVTSPNTGAAYAGAFKACTGTACWIHGLPSRVQLAAGETKKIPFYVTVPAGTPDKQYLAGITAQPKGHAPAVVVGKNGSASAHAIIIQQITVGVAVTVGKLATLSSSLRISRVGVIAIGAMPRLLVHVTNTGQRFTRARGSATCDAKGRAHGYAVLANTILPGDSAVVDVNAPGLPAHSLDRCVVELPFASGATRWVGKIRIASLKAPKLIPVGPGQYSRVPRAHFPTWAIAALAGGGALTLVLLGILLSFIRRYRQQVKAAEMSTKTRAPADA